MGVRMGVQEVERLTRTARTATAGVALRVRQVVGGVGNGAASVVGRPRTFAHISVDSESALVGRGGACASCGDVLRE